jgi:hypothetical protein
LIESQRDVSASACKGEGRLGFDAEIHG